MNKEKLLLKNTAIVALGQICTKFIGFFLLPLYTAVLSSEEYGTVDIFNTYVSLLLPLMFFQIEQASFRFLIDVRQNDTEKIKIITTVFLTFLIQSALFLLLYFLVGNFIRNDYKYFLATNVVATMFSNIMLQISRGLGDNNTYSLGSLVSGSGTIILNVIFIVIFGWGAYGMLLAVFIANCMCGFFVFFKKRIFRYIKIKYYSFKEIIELWKYSLPMVPNQLSWWIINASNRTIITYTLGVGMNGVFSAANKFSTICITIFNVFNLTWTESASVFINDEESDDYFTKVFNITIKLFTCLCFGIIACMPFLFNYLITGASYREAYFQIPILLLSTIFNIVVSMLGSIYVALKKTNEIAKTSFFAAIINVFVNIILINFIGLYSSSIAMLVAFLLMTLYRYRDIQRYKTISVDKSFVFYSLIIGIIILVIYYLRNKYLCFLGIIIAIFFAYIENKRIFFKIIEIIQNKFNLVNHV